MSEPKHRFEAETLGLPPLRMILVNTNNDERDHPMPIKKNKGKKELDKIIVLRLIDHLNNKL